MVKNGLLTAEWALVADDKLGFGRGPEDAMPDADSPANRLAAALREEDHSRLDDDALESFSKTPRRSNPGTPKCWTSWQKTGTVVRYGQDSHEALVEAFADFSLEALGPSREQLQLCCNALASYGNKAGQLRRRFPW